MIIHVWKNFYVATVDDWEKLTYKQLNEFYVIGACRRPLHYRFAKKDDEKYNGEIYYTLEEHEKEYHYCVRDRAVYLNLENHVQEKDINDTAIKIGLYYMDKFYKEQQDVLIVDKSCVSRAPSMILLWLIHAGFMDKKETVEEMLNGFKKNLYRDFQPSKGMLKYIESKFNERREFYNAKQEKNLRQ